MTYFWPIVKRVITEFHLEFLAYCILYLGAARVKPNPNPK